MSWITGGILASQWRNSAITVIENSLIYSGRSLMKQWKSGNLRSQIHMYLRIPVTLRWNNNILIQSSRMWHVQRLGLWFVLIFSEARRKKILLQILIWIQWLIVIFLLMNFIFILECIFFTPLLSEPIMRLREICFWEISGWRVCLQYRTFVPWVISLGVLLKSHTEATNTVPDPPYIHQSIWSITLIVMHWCSIVSFLL